MATPQGQSASGHSAADCLTAGAGFILNQSCFHGHYCKVCGEYKANEKFSGKGHAAHICKKCAALPADVRSAQMIENKLLSLPWRLSKEQIKWLNNKAHDKRPEIRELAQEQLDMRFHPERLASNDTDEFEDLLLDEDEW